MRILSMRTFLFVIAALLLSATTCSCSREDDPEEQKEEQEDKKVEDWENEDIDGDATMESAAMSFFIGGNDPLTRSSTTYAGVCTLETDDLVAVGIIRSGESEDVKLYKVLSTGYLEYAGSGEPFLWKSRNEQVSIRAWSYGSSTQTANTLTPPESYDYSLETDQQTNGYNELLYCKSMNKKCSDGMITFTFYHQLARVVFNVKHQKRADLIVNSVTLGNSTFPVSARFVLPTGDCNVGSWNMKSTKSTITPKSENPKTGFDRTYSAVVFPDVNYAQNTSLLTINNTEGNYAYKIIPSGGVTFDAGKQYYYTITVKDVVPKLPIEYLIGTHNMQNATTMASDDKPESMGYFHYGSNKTTMTATMKSFHNGITISGNYYHLPTVREWTSVVPPYYSQFNFDWLGCEGPNGSRISWNNTLFVQTGRGEIIEWGRMKDGTYTVPAQMFYNEYATHASDANYGNTSTAKHGYAIRHKDRDVAGPSGYGKYTCAYRYTYQYTDDGKCNGHKSFRIKVRYLGASSTTSLSEITNDAYWNQSGATYYEIIFPTSGRTLNSHYQDYPYSTDPASYPPNGGNQDCGYLWSSNPLYDESVPDYAYYMHFRPGDCFSDTQGQVGIGWGVRLFKDTE